ncbi:glycosyltransferase family A protein [Chitinophaga caseinilytica]|uniref:Glycosyltransferase family A protein n=1 Tax=Chitinophaga caseinilytica TaxID=2267521 RepID=A0ABZ2Z6M7_9BACT
MKVSICVIIYNHGKYIRQCLESILAQQTDFPVELIISDDKSKDDSVHQVNSLLASIDIPPQISIVRLFHEQNMGMNLNWRSAIERATGEYITIIEGDDYWEGTNKLATQIAFLETHPQYSGAANETRVLHMQTGQYTSFTAARYKNGPMPEAFGMEEYLASDCLCHTSSLVYRNVFCGKPLPDLVNTSMTLDQAIFTLFNEQNLIRYFNEPWSVYRVHPAGITQSSRHRNIKLVTQNQIQMFMALDKATDQRFGDTLKNKVKKLRFELVRIKLYLPHMKRWLLKNLRSQ